MSLWHSEWRGSCISVSMSWSPVSAIVIVSRSAVRARERQRQGEVARDSLILSHLSTCAAVWRWQVGINAAGHASMLQAQVR
jgi:hypothetical protein